MIILRSAVRVTEGTPLNRGPVFSPAASSCSCAAGDTVLRLSYWTRYAATIKAIHLVGRILAAHRDIFSQAVRAFGRDLAATQPSSDHGRLLAATLKSLAADTSRPADLPDELLCAGRVLHPVTCPFGSVKALYILARVSHGTGRGKRDAQADGTDQGSGSGVCTGRRAVDHGCSGVGRDRHHAGGSGGVSGSRATPRVPDRAFRAIECRQAYSLRLRRGAVAPAVAWENRGLPRPAPPSHRTAELPGVLPTLLVGEPPVLQSAKAQVDLWSVTCGDARGLDRWLRCIPRMLRLIAC